MRRSVRDHCLSASQWRSLHVLWEALDKLDTTYPDEYTSYGLKLLGDLVGADLAFMLVLSAPVVEDGELVNAPELQRLVFSPGVASRVQRAVTREFRSKKYQMPGYMGEFETACPEFRAAIIEETFLRPNIVRSFSRMGFQSGITAGGATSSHTEVHVECARALGERAFTPEELNLLHVALHGASAWLARCGLLLGSQGGRKPLAPRGREVFGLALRGFTEQQIAEELNLTVGTTHQYMMTVYRHFGVSSRSELIGIWTFGPYEGDLPRMASGDLLYGRESVNGGDTVDPEARGDGFDEVDFHELLEVRTALMRTSPRKGNRILYEIFDQLRETLCLTAGHVVCTVRRTPREPWKLARVAIRTWDRERPIALYDEIMERTPSNRDDPFFKVRIAPGERSVVALRKDVATDEEWRKSYVYRVMAANGVSERAVLHIRVNDLCNVSFGFDRCEEDGVFDERERVALETLAEGLSHYAWRCAFILGSVRGEMPLAPREREALGYITAGVSDGEIASRMAISTSTVQTYNSAIYGALDVNGRSELMSLWLPTPELMRFE